MGRVRRTMPHVGGHQEAERPQWCFETTTRTVELGWAGISFTERSIVVSYQDDYLFVPVSNRLHSC